MLVVIKHTQVRMVIKHYGIILRFRFGLIATTSAPR